MMKELNASIDYLTVTSESWHEIVSLVDQVLKAIPNLGYEKQWHWMNYKGFVYVSDDGHLAWGTKAGHGLIQMSGACSDQVLRSINVFNLDSYKCTRLDLAVTVCLDEPKKLVEEAVKDWQEGTSRRSAILKNNGEGGTLYLGCRASDQFGRLYDKGAEIRSRLKKDSMPLCQLWRYEVEYKRSWAREMRRSLFNVMKEERDFAQHITYIVWRWFLDHGIAPEFQPLKNYSSIVSVDTRITDAQKTLDWLSVQVKPAIVRVAKDKSLREILMALGFDAAEGDIGLLADAPILGYLQFAMWGFPRVV